SAPDGDGASADLVSAGADGVDAPARCGWTRNEGKGASACRTVCRLGESARRMDHWSCSARAVLRNPRNAEPPRLPAMDCALRFGHIRNVGEPIWRDAMAVSRRDRKNVAT